MGGQLSRMMARIFGTTEMRILMLGLDAAGKTTILYRMRFKQEITTIPTVGFNVETVQIERVKFNVWDVGGQDKIRPLWRHYYTGTQGLIFVVDSSDRARIEEARQELNNVLGNEEMKGALLLIFANKQDVPGAMKPDEITEKMKLSELERNTYFTQGSIATTGEGLVEGMGWLSHAIKYPPKNEGSARGN